MSVYDTLLRLFMTEANALERVGKWEARSSCYAVRMSTRKEACEWLESHEEEITDDNPWLIE